MLAFASTAHAGDDESGSTSYRAVIDRVDLEPASVTGYRLRVYLSALALQGQLLDLTDPRSIKLYLGSSVKKPPYALGTYDATDGDTAIVVMVQASLDFTEALPLISDAIDRQLLANLGDRTQIAVLQYGAANGRWWVQPYLHAAAEQTHLSSLDALYRVGSVFLLALVALSLAYLYYRYDRGERA